MGNDTKTVLVVDDEDIIRGLTCDILLENGYKVIEARNGREGMDIFRKSADAVDIVILDMSMPEMDGIQTFDALRLVRPDIKVLVSSGFTEDPSVARLLKKGAIGVLTKPFKIDDLVRTIQGALKA